MGLRGEERQGLSADWEEEDADDDEAGLGGRANVFNRASDQAEGKRDVARSGRGYDYLFCEEDPVVNKSDLLSALRRPPPAFFHSHHNNH